MNYRLKPPAIALAAMVAAFALTSCGSDSGGPGTTSTIASPDSDGFTPEQREVVDAVEKYTATFVELRKGNDADLKSVATPEVADLIGNGVKQQVADGRVMIGEYKLVPASVSISGDKARYRGCNDFSKSFTVKKGDTKPGVGSSAGEASKVDFKLVRNKGTWLLSDPKSTGETC